MTRGDISISGVGERVVAVSPYSTILEETLGVVHVITAAVFPTVTEGVTNELVQIFFWCPKQESDLYRLVRSEMFFH